MKTMKVNYKFPYTIFATIFLILTIDECISKPAQKSDSAEISDNEIENEEIKSQIPSESSDFRTKYGQKMITFMNQSVDPCQDFYEFACGNWQNVIVDRQAQHKRSNLIDISYELGDVADRLLQEPAENLKIEYLTEYKMVQQFYQSCLEADLYNFPKSAEYLNEIKSIGGFPAVDSTWDAEKFNWFNMSAHLSNYGIDGLTKEETFAQYPFAPYFKLPDLGFDFIVNIDNIATNSSRAYQLNEKRMRKYLTLYEVDEPMTTKVIDEVFDFWRAFLNITKQFNEDLDQCLELELSADTTKTFDSWQTYFAIAWAGQDFNITEDDCPCDFFYIELDKICSAHKEAVANYLAMKFLYHMDARLDKLVFQKEYCIHEIRDTFPILIDKLYLKEFFNLDVRNDVTKIVKEVRQSLREILQEADWLDESTRQEALKKESDIVSRIGNFEDPLMTDRLIREINRLTYVNDNYEKNNINLKKFQIFMARFNGLHRNELSNSTKPKELLIAMQVNAFYYNIDNSINIMAGILHPPAYHILWPTSLKFGTIGYLVGHELTHGFDTVGAYFDNVGAERIWWSNKAGRMFEERSNCFVKHYNKYLIPEINRNVNGNITKDENLADSGGLREALKAYRRYMKQLSKDAEQNSLFSKQDLPGIDFSPEQIFFLGFAQLWCSAYKEEHYWEELGKYHTVNKYRVLGAVTNNDDFAKAYNCPLGSEMNPNAEKCRLW